MAEYIGDNPQFIVNGFVKAGIWIRDELNDLLQRMESDYEASTASKACDNTQGD